MNLFLLRHGIAVDRNSQDFPDDCLRPLTSAGEKRLRLAAEAMRQLKLPIDVILCSPFLRTRQTAEIIASCLRLPSALRLLEDLTPSGDRRKLIRHINRIASQTDNILLVGHEPYLGELLSVLISGSATVAVDFKKGALARLHVAQRLEFGRCATLKWLVTPRQLALLS